MSNLSPVQILTQMLLGGNPMQMIQNQIQSNPQLKAMINQQRQSGMSMEQYVRQVAKQQNVDIEPMLNMLRQRGIK